MIRLPFASWFKNNLDKLWEKERLQIQEDYAQRQSSLLADFDLKQKELESRLSSKKSILDHELKDIQDLEKRLADRKSELERSNRELREQIRILEARSKPDRVWESAFSAGFSKAWDMMLPHMTKGMEKIKDVIREQEIDQTIPRLNQMVDQKIEELKLFTLRDIAQVDSKIKSFEIKKSSLKNPEDIKKMDHYLEVLNWVMEQRNGH